MRKTLLRREQINREEQLLQTRKRAEGSGQSACSPPQLSLRGAPLWQGRAGPRGSSLSLRRASPCPRAAFSCRLGWWEAEQVVAHLGAYSSVSCPPLLFARRAIPTLPRRKAIYPLLSKLTTAEASPPWAGLGSSCLHSRESLFHKRKPQIASALPVHAHRRALDGRHSPAL